MTTLTLVRGVRRSLSWTDDFKLFGDLGEDAVPVKERDGESPVFPKLRSKGCSPDLPDIPKMSLSTGITDSVESCVLSILNEGNSPVGGTSTLISLDITWLSYILAPPSSVDLASA